MAGAAASSASSASTATSSGSRGPVPRSLRASVSSASIRASARSAAWRTSTAIASSCAGVRPGLASVTSIAVRITVSGVRSSCEALATNRRWLAKAASSRPSMASNVSASSFSSSSGPASAIRSPRFSSEARRAAAVMACTGRSARPATIQPSHAEANTSAASAASE